MTDTLITEGQNTTAADQQQSAETQTESHVESVGEQAEPQQQEANGQESQSQSTEGELESKTEGAPEKYEFTPAEGTQFDEQVIGAFSEIAKELNLTQEAAQKVLDKMAPAIQARQSEQIAAVQSAWANQAKSDKEFGGDKLNESLAVAKKALETFGSPELSALLNESGMGNHPEIIRAFYRAGKAISEDRFVGGGAAHSRNDAKSFYAASNMNP